MALFEEGYTQNTALSWLNYNERVLHEALDETVPLFERLKYISIFMSNLEEFLQFNQNNGQVSRLLADKDKIHKYVEEKLAKSGVVRVEACDLPREELDKCKKYYDKEIKGRIKVHFGSDSVDFPSIKQEGSYVVSKLEGETKGLFALIEIPEELPKILVLNEGLPMSISLYYDFNAYKRARYGDTSFRYIYVEDIIRMYIADILSPFDALETTTFDKRFISAKASEEMTKFLIWTFQLERTQVYKTEKSDYRYVSELEEKIPGWLKDRLCWGQVKGFNQLNLGYGPVIDRLKRKEILCCYPYDSIEPFITLLKDCAIDSRVIEIRMTTYRLSSHPKIVELLEQAAQNGKKVTVVIELSARFDEENNVDWSERMRRKGVKIRYGDERCKIHSRLAQIVLEENGKTRYISYLSTGEFNEDTVLKYTDIGLITYDQNIGTAVNELWKDVLENRVDSYDHILTSPRTMKETLINLIRREAKKGKNGRIFIKVNSVSDNDLIEELKQASCAGCKIRMIVRGICCLLPEVEGKTDNIRIVNVVGRYLEHSRVYVFGMGKEELVYISSSDLITDNLAKRIELAVPIYNKELRRRIKAILYLNYMDNVKGRYLGSNGKYRKKIQGEKLVDSQIMLMG